MCAVTGKPPAQVCTLGDLARGAWFHDPNGETWQVIDLPLATGLYPDSVMVVNIGNGAGNRFGNAMTNDELRGIVTPMYRDLKLGYDHAGRLYSSTFLNGWYCDPDPVPDAVAQDAPLATPKELTDLMDG